MTEPADKSVALVTRMFSNEDVPTRDTFVPPEATMEPPLLWLAPTAADKVSGRCCQAKLWSTDVSTEVEEQTAGAKVAWA